MGFPLKRTMKRGNKRPIFGFDIETCNRNKDFVCASVWMGEDDYAFFQSKQELINFFKSKRCRNAIIAATNLSFDFYGTFFGSDEMMDFDILSQNSDLISAQIYVDREGKVYRKSGKGRDALTFIDTFNYLKCSVEKMGEILNFHKLPTPEFIGKRPKNKEEWQIMKDYNIRDSEVSARFMRFLMKGFDQLGASFKKTVASTAMSLFKNKYICDNVYWRQPKQYLLDQFEAYYGGRTEVFKRGVIDATNENPYNFYDINSLYPSVMMNEFPDPNSVRKVYQDDINNVHDFEGVSKVTITAPDNLKYPLLPHKVDGKLIFPVGTWTGSYSHLELRAALKLNYKIHKIHKTYYYIRKCQPFKEYVMDLYHKRLEYQAEDSPMEIVVKLMMNSLYGKFGQKFMGKDNFIPFNLTEKELEKYDNVERVGDFVRVVKDQLPAAHCIPIWALYVTAYARLKMYDYISICDPVYMDTDSIVTKLEVPTSTKLGDMKLERQIKFGIFFKPKMYALQDMKNKEYVKIKGVGTKVSLEDIKEMYEKGARKFSVSYQKFTKIREAARRNLPINYLQDVTKSLDLEDTKRIWEREFDYTLQESRPIKLIDGVSEITIEAKQVKKRAVKAYQEFNFVQESILESISTCL